MPTAGPLRPNHKAIQAYYDALKAYSSQHVEHEGALETAFSHLLADTARPHGWTLIPKMSLKVGGKTIAPDGTLRDEFYLRHGYWEAKDTKDDLDAEIRAKIRKGYPLEQHDFRGHSRSGPVPERPGTQPLRPDQPATARRSAQRLLRPRRAGL